MASNVNIPQKSTGDSRTSAEDNLVTNWINSPAQSLGTFDPSSITLDGSGAYSNYTTSGNISLAFTGTPEEGNWQKVLVTFNGSHTLTLPSGAVYDSTNITDGAAPASGTYWLWMEYSGGVYSVNLQKVTVKTGDVTSPTLDSISVPSGNATVTVTMSEGVYANDDGTGDLQVADFTAGLSGGTATSPVLSNPVHSAGGLTVTFDLAYTGSADGNETLTITVADGASVYDAAGNAMQAGQNATASLESDSVTYLSNGGFDTDTLWTKGVGWSISGGVAAFDGTDAANLALVQDAGDMQTPLARATSYDVTFDIVITNSSAKNFRLGARHNDGFGSDDLTSPEQITVDGTYTRTIVIPDTADYDGGGGFRVLADGGGAPPSFTIDNISIVPTP